MWLGMGLGLGVGVRGMARKTDGVCCDCAVTVTGPLDQDRLARWPYTTVVCLMAFRRPRFDRLGSTIPRTLGSDL